MVIEEIQNLKNCELRSLYNNVPFECFHHQDSWWHEQRQPESESRQTVKIFSFSLCLLFFLHTG